MSYLNAEIVLVLNNAWQAIGWKTPAQAIVSLCPEQGQEPPGYVIDVITDGEGAIQSAERYSWDDWCKLPVEPRHLPILTKRGAIRCPTVVVMASFGQMPVKAKGFSAKAIRERDKDTCQVSGRKLKPGEGNLGHDKARSKGGSKTFDNIVWMDKTLNLLQGTRTFAEMGWNLISKPQPPKPLPACVGIEPRQPEHRPFTL
jgi:hypothetical protein